MATALKFEHRAAEMPEAVCEYAILDVETMDASEDAVLRDFEENYDGAPKGWKDAAKIEEHRSEALLKWHDKAALLDAAPVAMVGLKLSEGQTFLLHGLKHEKAKFFGPNGKQNKVVIEGCAGEKDLMECVGTLLAEKTGKDTMLVGHAIYNFDLGKLRLATVRNGLPLPEALRVRLLEDDEKQRVFDTMQHFCRYFCKGGQMFISQDAMLERLGIKPLLKGVATGEDVPKLLKAGKMKQVAIKLLADLVGNEEAFVRMTGRGR